jgi:hypothetical protein
MESRVLIRYKQNIPQSGTSGSALTKNSDQMIAFSKMLLQIGFECVKDFSMMDITTDR